MGVWVYDYHRRSGQLAITHVTGVEADSEMRCIQHLSTGHGRVADTGVTRRREIRQSLH